MDDARSNSPSNSVTETTTNSRLGDGTSDSSGALIREPVVTADWDVDDWQLSDDLETAERLVRSHPSRRDHGHHAAPGTRWRVDDPHYRSTAGGQERDANFPTGSDASSTRFHGVTPSIPVARYVSWTLLAVGIMAFTCGGVLAAWSLATEQTRLWNIGVPLLLIGQAGLLLGLVLQLERLWRNYRRTREMLGGLETQLHDLQRTTTLLTGTHSSSAQSFYAHMAEGAHPELLLADLKSQLDLLAVKLSR